MSKPESYPACVISDPMALEPRLTSIYPEKYSIPDGKRAKRALGNVFGLTNFGVNLTTLQPGGWSSQRHWHTKQDELIYVVEGELTLITDAGETLLAPGMVAGFKAGVPDGHHLVNKSGRPARYLEIGDRTPGDAADYPDIDMKVAAGPDGKMRFTDKKGTPY